MCNETHPEAGQGPGGSEVEGLGCLRDRGQLMGQVELPELSARSSMFGTGSWSSSSLVSQSTCEVLQRALRESAGGGGSTRTC